MFSFQKSLSVLLFFIFFASLSSAQSITTGGGGNIPKTSEQKQDSESFTSVEGEFSISLSKSNIQGYRTFTLKDTGNLGVGALYMFRRSEVGYEIGYIDLAEAMQSLKDSEIKEKIKAFQNIVLGYAIDESQFKESRKDGNLVVDAAMAEADGDKYLSRYIRRGKRIYVLTARPGSEQSETAAVLKIFDSIKFVSGKEIIDRQVAEAMPKPLPQTPVVKKVRTDAEDENLKGKVRSIIEWNEDLTGTWSSQGKVLNWETHYNAQGHRVKTIFYDSKGLPYSVKVFGYIDNARVSLERRVEFESSLRITTLSTKTDAETKPRDSRYTSKLVNKYDEQNRLTEEAIYDNDGTLSYKNVYSYKGNKVEEWRYYDDVLTYKETRTLDAKGNEVESEWEWTKTGTTGKYTYTYEQVDEKGNWLRRLVSGTEAGGRIQKYFEHRKIEYYP